MSNTRQRINTQWCGEACAERGAMNHTGCWRGRGCLGWEHRKTLNWKFTQIWNLWSFETRPMQNDESFSCGCLESLFSDTRTVVFYFLCINNAWITIVRPLQIHETIFVDNYLFKYKIPILHENIIWFSFEFKQNRTLIFSFSALKVVSQ